MALANVLIGLRGTGRKPSDARSPSPFSNAAPSRAGPARGRGGNSGLGASRPSESTPAGGLGSIDRSRDPRRRANLASGQGGASNKNGADYNTRYEQVRHSWRETIVLLSVDVIDADSLSVETRTCKGAVQGHRKRIDGRS